MLIDGRIIASSILDSLIPQVHESENHGTVPKLAVIQIGSDIASTSYIRMKKRAAEKTGIKLSIINYQLSISENELVTEIQKLNSDPGVHGIIIQRPVPDDLKKNGILDLVKPGKDVDGFVPDSKFTAPVAAGVGEILKFIKSQVPNHNDQSLFDWLKFKKITVIGRGETAGGPIIKYLKYYNCTTSNINSQTANPQEVLLQSDIIISCVGKNNIVSPDFINKGVILIGVGIWRDEFGKLRGDYNEARISTKAAFYTPTPGGVGPVNVACLMQNTIHAAIQSITT